MPYYSLIPFLLMGLLATSSIIPLATTGTTSPQIYINKQKKKISEIFSLSPYSFWGSLISGLILSAIYSFAPTFAIFAKSSPSLVMTTTLAGGFILQWPMGYLSDIFNRKKVLLITSLMTLIPCLLLLFLPPYPIIVLITCFLLGGSCFALYPLSLSQAYDSLTPNYHTYVTSRLSLIYGAGSIIGPLLASFFIKILNPSALFIYIGLQAILLSIIGLVLIKREKPIISITTIVSETTKTTPQTTISLEMSF